MGADAPVATLPAELEICTRRREGGLPCLGLAHRPRPETTYCVRCGVVDGPVAHYTLVEAEQAS